MHAYLAEVNTTPGDFSGNYEQIAREISLASQAKADVIVFPELTVCGYLVRDLLYLDYFVTDNLRYLKMIQNDSSTYPQLTIIVGYVDYSHKEYGKRFRNMAAVIRNGLIIATYQKQLLPFYDVFDEPRYFEPGSELCKIKIAGETCGITICEDLWNDKGQDDYNYAHNPVKRYLDVGVTTIINLSSSPYHVSKVSLRAKMAREISKSCTLIYVNQIGGQDELVFDGHSMIASRQRITHVGNGLAYTKDLYTADAAEALITKSGTIEELTRMIVLGLKDYVHKTGHDQVVINSSGGVDSAVVIALAAKAFGGENVHCIRMPSRYSSTHSLQDASELHMRFGCKEYTVSFDHQPILSSLNEAYLSIKKDAKPVAEENVQARMRGLMGAMYFSNAFGALPLTTGNKTELALGYCTLYGDMSGGFNPIGDLYKNQVVEVGRLLNVPKQILNKAPSAELRPDQTDEDSLMPYCWLNSIVCAFIEEYISDFDTWRDWYIHYFQRTSTMAGIVLKDRGERVRRIDEQVSKEDYDRMIRLIKLNEFKRRQAAPCVKVSKVAFGMGRRMPLVHRS